MQLLFVTEVPANPKGGVPATVRDAVLGRATNLKPSAREMLEFASIVPRAIETSLIDTVLAPALEAVEECVKVTEATLTYVAVDKERRPRVVSAE